jgi:hypothetical protein
MPGVGSPQGDGLLRPWWVHDVVVRHESGSVKPLFDIFFRHVYAELLAEREHIMEIVLVELIP